MIRILLVDDEPDLLELERRVLEQKFGFTTITATSGKEALRIFHEMEVDAIVSDYSMPEMDGITLLRLIREENKQIPFLLFTIREKEEIAIEALNSGANYFVQKEHLPQVVFAELAHNVNNAVELFRAEKNLKIQRDLALDNASSKSLEETLLICVRAMMDVSGMDSAAIYLYEENTFTLGIARGVFSGYTSETVTDILVPLMNHILDEGAPVFRDKDQIYDSTPALTDEEKIVSDAFLPMSHHGRSIGLVHICSHTQAAALSLSLQGYVADIVTQIASYIADRLAEEALRKSEKRMTAMIRNLPGMVYQGRIDNERTMEFVSEAVFTLTGYEPGEIIENQVRSWGSLIHHHDQPRILEVINEAAEKSSRFRLTYRLQTKDNKYRWVSEQGTWVYDNEGTIIGIEGIVIDISRQKALDDQVRMYHTRLKTMFMLMNAGCLIFRSIGTLNDTVLVDINSAAEKIEQKSKTEVIGKPFTEIFPGDDAALSQALSGILEDKKPRSLMRYPRRMNNSIHYFEVFLNIAPSGKDKNDCEVFLIYNDVTNRVKSEQQIISSLREKDLLLKEVHHRVKNNLQIITGMLKLQSLRITDTKALEIIRECSNQVYSMASIHELLYNSRDIGKIKVEEYINRLVDHFKQEYEGISTRLVFHVEVDPEIVLDIERCIPCGLILNELIMNAVKHAFDPEREGEVTISFIQDLDTFTMKIADNGRGFPSDFDIKKSLTLGMELTKRLSHQLRGEVIITNDKGAEISVVFPKTSGGGLKV